MSAEPESFLVRWSRRKRAAEREAERPAEAAAPEVPAAAPAKLDGEGIAVDGSVPAPSPTREPAAATEVPLPPIESLDGLRSDYQAFFQQPVDEGLRHAALTKLFADPHFNQMDMLDVYVDDYTQFEPMPAAMRMRLPSARAFLHGSELAEVEAAEAAAAAADDESESRVAAAGAEHDHAASPGAVEETSGLAVENANAESTSALTAAPSAAPADAASTDDPPTLADLPSSPAIPPGKTAAPDPSST
jgi:Protein of unknown function (DUF3306)